MSQTAKASSTPIDPESCKIVPFYMGSNRYELRLVRGPRREPIPGEICYEDTPDGWKAAEARKKVLDEERVKAQVARLS